MSFHSFVFPFHFFYYHQITLYFFLGELMPYPCTLCSSSLIIKPLTFPPSTSQPRTTNLAKFPLETANLLTSNTSAITKIIPKNARKHSPNSVRNQSKHQCKLCMKYLSRKSTLNSHYQHIHGLNIQEINRFDNKPQKNVLQVRLVRKETPIERIDSINNSTQPATITIQNQLLCNVSGNSNISNVNPNIAEQNCSVNSVNNFTEQQQQHDVFVIDEYLDESPKIEDLNEVMNLI